MSKNPYPEFDIRHQVWEEGYRAGRTLFLKGLTLLLVDEVEAEEKQSVRLPIDEGLGGGIEEAPTR